MSRVKQRDDRRRDLNHLDSHEVEDPSAVREAVRGIVAGLKISELRHDALSSTPRADVRFDLADGCAGTGIFLAEAARHLPDMVADEEVSKHVAAAVKALDVESAGLGLFHGTLGVACAIELQAVDSQEADGDDPNSEIDQLLATLLEHDDFVGRLDHVHGLAGMGRYLLTKRAPSSSSIDRVVTLVGSHTVEDSTGISWFTPREFVPETRAPLYPSGHFDLGLAHGVPGIIAFLSAAHFAGHSRAETARLVDGGVSWLLSQSLDSARLRFPTHISTTRREPGRDAWCYGEIGIACALLSAAEALDDGRLRAHAAAIALSSATRAVAEHCVIDSGLCHGSAGLAHMYRHFAVETGEPEFRKASEFWLQHTLKMREPNVGVAGFRGLKWFDGDAPRWKNQEGLICGAAGVGVMLLAHSFGASAAIDRLLAIRN